ncbi:D-cysteine desulfhydrase 1, mitochondrial-like [Lolium perenne]|uniref:D-cysteine desulfhydrase 1, mitochondrial-like n=1 Tax=Lolium perenne TaxID=4522 RepID=UPI0021F5ECEC|nr:putative D-cysteine desulfhydrase 1, mitochondrial [Lolium perenne]XP_051178555.1 putative D-cysteine desulfhydrase 1, mitochondrial [Lolium perenne]XP_051178556.1 putative D-cysteine desulfhydrase 1, mitochondrial [Lolium perenne]
MVPNTSILQLFSPHVTIRRRTSTAANSVTFAVSSTATQIGGFLSKKPYTPPSWASDLSLVPSHNFTLGQFPTPIHKWNLPNLPKDTEVWIKRDDLAGMELSGNKVRKLEFLMADAVAQGADCVITVGGIQSNHCRATAVAAKYVNLDCYVILVTSKLLVDEDPGLVGNLLVERLLGAHIDLVSKGEFSKIGSVALTDLLKKRLLEGGRKPYVISGGGSNSLGNWGYIEAVREIEQQIKLSGNVQFDDIVVACGSGGTVAGLALGSHLSTLKTKVHGFSVCYNPGYFYDNVQGLIDGLQSGLNSHDIVRIEDAKGLGYAMNTAEELKFVKDIAAATGIVLDPVYSGKAAYRMLKDMANNPTKWEGRKVLFVHTGGLLGLYDKVDQLSSLAGSWRRMDLQELIHTKKALTNVA